MSARLQRDYLKVGQERGIGRQSRADRAIKGRQDSVVGSRKSEQVSIRELARALYVIKALPEGWAHKVDISGPPNVHSLCQDSVQADCGRQYVESALRNTPRGQYAHHTELRDRTGGPTVIANPGEPNLCCEMIPLSRPEQSHQDVYIQEPDPCHGNSARIRAMSSLVTSGKSSGVSKTRIPESDMRSPNCFKPRRARVDTARPSGICCASASSRASTRTSSSIVNVVRMMQSYHRDAPPVMAHHGG